MTQLTRFAIKVTLETQASFSDAPAMGNNTQTLGYIPGSALRGMLASQYLAKHSTGASGEHSPDTNFHRLFVDGAIQFPNLYPANSRCLPLSAYSCKYHAGFRQDDLPTFMIPPHCVVDRLWEDFFPKPPSDCIGLFYKIPHRDCMHPSCQQPLTPLQKSFYTGTDAFQTTEPELITRMSTAVLGSSGSARQGSLHSEQELAARQDFRGFLLASPQDFAMVKAKLGTAFSGYLGRKRAGAAQVSLTEYESDWDQPNIINNPQQPGFSYVAMTCTSELILVDDLLRPITVLTNDNFPGLVNPPATVELVKAFASSRMIAGWFTVGRLFKENDLAISAGSTFLLQFSSQDERTMLTWMQDLQMHGLGLRRSEGFGQITFSEPLHRRSWQRLESHLNNPTTEDFRL